MRAINFILDAFRDKPAPINQTFLVDGYNLQIKSTSDAFGIKITNPVTQEVHSCIIDNITAHRYSSGRFSTAEALVQELVKGLEGKVNGLTISIEDGDKIHYSLEQNIQNFQRVSKFTINVPNHGHNFEISQSAVLQNSQLANSKTRSQTLNKSNTGKENIQDDLGHIVTDLQVSFTKFEKSITERLTSLENRVSKIEDRLGGVKENVKEIF